MSAAVLVARDLSLVREGRLLIDKVSFDIPAERVTVLFGPVGSGKSSLLKVLSRQVLDGVCTVSGQLIYAGSLLGPDNHPPLLPQKAACSEAEAMAAIEALARSNPALICLDEVTTLLDKDGRRRVLDRLRQEARHRAVLLITHNITEGREVADHVILLSGGKIQEATDAERFFARPASDAGRHFLRTGSHAAASSGAPTHHIAPDQRPLPDHLQFAAPNGRGEAITWIIDKRLGVAATPGARSSFEKDIKDLGDAGVTALVDIGTSARVDDPKGLAPLNHHGLVGVWFPVHSNAKDRIAVGKLLCEECQRLLDEDQRVVVHGGESPEVTATVIAAQLVHQGVAAQKAVEIVTERLPGVSLSLKDEQYLWDLELGNAVELELRMDEKATVA